MRDRFDNGTEDMFGGGEERKRRKIKQALDNESERWKLLYEKHANDYLAGLRRGAEFQGENLRAYVVKRIGKPHVAGVWGGMFRSVTRSWLDRGIIVLSGEMAAAKARRSNGHMFRTYVKVLATD